MQHRYTWLPDLPDVRDKKYAQQHMLSLEPLPASADLRSAMPPVFDQRDIGSCTANSLAGALGFLELRSMNSKIASAELFDSTVFTPFSRLFIYYNERLIEGDVDQDGGAQLRDGIKSLAGYGACRESLWGYEDNLLYQKPISTAYDDAYSHRITSYSRLESIYDMKHALSSGFPFVFGFTVYESFESPMVATSGIMTMPAQTEECMGGHAVCAVGYDDEKQWFVVRNSWGPTWGDKGYFYMPYSYITNPDLADDFWSIKA